MKRTYNQNRYRHTKIIFTIGPATESEEMLTKLINEGVDICRINMAHADHDWTRATIEKIRKVSKKVGREISIMMDVKGPEIRTCALGKPIFLEQDQRVDLSIDANKFSQDSDGTPVLGVNYPSLIQDISVGNEVQVDNGLLKFEVIGKTESRIQCKVVIGGELGSRRHINLPGVKINLPAITEKDRGDIQVGHEAGVDQYALSFVREATDIDILREFMVSIGATGKVVAKIEDQSALSNLNEIIQAADCLMVARGDLGIECPYEELPIIQRRAVKQCLLRGKGVIVATHMLESMIENPVPTRAEVTDVANAVYEQADCIMLSGETTIGKYPLECVQAFKRISLRIERSGGAGFAEGRILKGARDMMLRSAKMLAEELHETPIVVFTKTGRFGEILSSLRCKAPVYAFTDRLEILRHLVTLWGIEPFLMDFCEDPEQTIKDAFQVLQERKWVKKGQQLVVITNVLAHDQLVDTVQLRYVD
ncbi:MAG: pyruvate kinase [Verrucomicrobia bacterium]|nr:pyruvate kinase [Verrucomicrobiota bacterium]MDA1064979.1 pyruvate kinase [Verrucomicrobiota bacterium]